MDILIVDDEPSLLRAMSRVLRSHGNVTAASGVVEALQILENKTFDLVVSDYNLEDGFGSDVLQAAWNKQPEKKRILFTASNCAPCSDIYDLVSKPDFERLAVLLDEAKNTSL